MAENSVDTLLARAERAEARVKELEESLHYCNGTADLAMKHRDEAEDERKEYIHKSATDNGRISKLRNLVLERAAERDELAGRVGVLTIALEKITDGTIFRSGQLYKYEEVASQALADIAALDKGTGDG